MKKIELKGKKIGRLKVIKELDERRNGKVVWLCECDCGNTVKVISTSLSSKRTKSCGCRRNITNRKRLKTHGHAEKGNRSTTYKKWAGMKRRCDNPNEVSYKRYGGRGITYCDRWNDFSNFLEDMGECPNGKTLERKDPDGNYTPDNCKWLAAKRQSRNRRDTVYLTYKGHKLPLPEWAEVLGIKRTTLWARINVYDWPVEKALSTPVN